MLRRFRILPQNLHNLINTKARSEPYLYPANPANHPTHRALTHAAGRGSVLYEQPDDLGLAGGASELLPRAQAMRLTGTRCMLPGRGRQPGLGAWYVVKMGFAVLVIIVGLAWWGILGSMVILRVRWGRIMGMDSFEIFGVTNLTKQGRFHRTNSY